MRDPIRVKTRSGRPIPGKNQNSRIPQPQISATRLSRAVIPI